MLFMYVTMFMTLNNHNYILTHLIQKKSSLHFVLLEYLTSISHFFESFAIHFSFLIPHQLLCSYGG